MHFKILHRAAACIQHLIGLALLCGCSVAPPLPSPHTTAPTFAGSEAIVAAHNRERAAVGVPPLQWSETLSVYAQAWAEHLARAQVIEHRPSSSPYGENIVVASSGMYSAGSMVQSLIDGERAHYNPKSGGCIGGHCRHYTQVVWRNSRTVGCGVALGPGPRGWTTSAQYWVCNYDPAGNLASERAY